VSLARRGLRVGVVDADIYGFSVPRMIGAADKPQQVDSMIVPPVAHDVSVISIGMFTPGNTAVVWRGPMLHRALNQFVAAADRVATTTGGRVPLVGQIPRDSPVREGGDTGVPVVIGAPGSPAAQALEAVAEQLAARSRSLVGRSLGLAPVGR